MRVRLTGVVGWVLLTCGAGVLLYIAYALLFTNVAADQAQRDLRTQWDRQVASATPPEASLPRPSAVPSAPPSAAPAPSAGTPDRPAASVALLEFSRPGHDRRPVHDEPLVVLDGVSVADLRRGPGHYPSTALPGREGNFAVAGHRTTYGAPFLHLDDLRRGDRVVVTDREGRRFAYEVARQRVVAPTDVSVIDDDPLGTGRPTLTLTTCTPRYSAARRLIVHAELVS